MLSYLKYKFLNFKEELNSYYYEKKRLSEQNKFVKELDRLNLKFKDSSNYEARLIMRGRFVSKITLINQNIDSLKSKNIIVKILAFLRL